VQIETAVHPGLVRTAWINTKLLRISEQPVYNHATVARKAFMVLGGRKEIESGFFTETWELPDEPPPR
jgi:hypothetical protein